MRKRLEGNVSILEDDEGNEISVAHIYGNTVVVRQGDWVTIRETAANPQAVALSVSSEPIPALRLRFYEVSVELRSNIPEIIQDFTRIYGRFARVESGPADMMITALSTGMESPRAYAMLMEPGTVGGLYLKGDFCRVNYLSSFEHLLFQVHQETEVFLLTNNPAHMFIHGGTVERNGAGYMMPAETKKGKTTLTLALVREGYGFMSDEFAVLDRQGILHPYPRSLSVRGDTLRLFPELNRRRMEFPMISNPVDSLYSVDPWSTFPVKPGRPCAVRYVIFPTYEPSADPAIRAISRMEAVRRLVGTRNFISLGRADKQYALDFLLSVLLEAECFDLTTGDLRKTTALVNSLEA